MRLVPTQEQVLRLAVPLVYKRRWLNLLWIALLTVFLGYQAAHMQVEAGFRKSIPLDHPYMQTLERYRETFGGANLIAVALIQKHGRIYNRQFLHTLDQVTDAVFFLPGVDRAHVRSLFTPGVRYIEITENGFASGDVVPRNYKPSPAMFDRIEENVGKADIIGRLVSNDQKGAMVRAQLLEFDPATGKKLDYRRVADQLEDIRARFSTDNIDIRIIGFAKFIGDVTDAAEQVLAFFAIALALTVLLLWLFCGSFRLSLLPLFCTLVAVVWEFGLVHSLGMGLDPFAVLVPFLVLAIGVSHGVQMINSWVSEVADTAQDAYAASVATFRKLAIPGTTALITDVIGFATIAFIDIDIIQNMAIHASLGMAAIILTNKLLMPVLLSYVRIGDRQRFRRRQEKRKRIGDRIWRSISGLTQPRAASLMIVFSAVLLGAGAWKYHDLKIGDLTPGVPELRPDSRYNVDARVIASEFSIGVDVLRIIAEADPEACIDYPAMDAIDRFAWRMQNTRGVASVNALPLVARFANVGFNEGYWKWYALPRDRHMLGQVISPVPTSAGLRNPDCTAMPVTLFTADHRAATIDNVIGAAKAFKQNEDTDGVHFALATGNVAVMAATNEVIERMELPILLGVYAALIVFIWLSFRTVGSIIAIVYPLALTSVLTYAFMAFAGIGLKAATLPVVALGVGWGVDDSIYLWSVLGPRLAAGETLRQAWFHTLQRTGRAVVFTSVAVLVSVATWLFSGLQFQADMGLLMVFMFTANLLGAIFILPAMAYFFCRPAQPTSE